MSWEFKDARYVPHFNEILDGKTGFKLSDEQVLEVVRELNHNWKLKLFKILKCFEEMEGTWFGGEWESFGVTPAEKQHIEKEYAIWHDNLTSSSHVKNQAKSETPSAS